MARNCKKFNNEKIFMRHSSKPKRKKMELQRAAWSDYKHEFLVCVFPDSMINLSKFYTRRSSDKSIILKE